MRSRYLPLLRRLIRTRIGRRLVIDAAVADPSLALGAAGWVLQQRASLDTVVDWPDELAGFEDLALVFSSNQANHGIAQLSIAEAAHLYRLARSAVGPVVEIGRYKGGGTLVLASALGAGGELWSYDTHEKAGRDVDDGLVRALDRFGLASRVHLVVGSSHEVDLPSPELALVFLDGDPTYAGTRADVERWGSALQAGGHLLLHDATPSAPRYPQIGKLVAELDADSRWRRLRDVDTLVHFQRQAG
jgi:predicted O-methyltransferase YrrM